jgi:isoleucyl-tRNA synthetase
LTPELVRGGYAREVVNRIQRARKDMNFAVSDRITVHFSASGELAQAIDEHRDYVMHETLCVTLENELAADAATQTEIDGHPLGFTLQRQGE